MMIGVALHFLIRSLHLVDQDVYWEWRVHHITKCTFDTGTLLRERERERERERIELVHSASIGF